MMYFFAGALLAVGDSRDAVNGNIATKQKCRAALNPSYAL